MTGQEASPVAKDGTWRPLGIEAEDQLVVREAYLTAVAIARARSLVLALVILSALVAGCGVRSRGADGVGIIAATQEIEFGKPAARHRPQTTQRSRGLPRR